MAKHVKPRPCWFKSMGRAIVLYDGMDNFICIINDNSWDSDDSIHEEEYEVKSGWIY